MKKIIALGLCGILLLTFLTGCSDEIQQRSGGAGNNMNGLKTETWRLDHHGTIYTYMPNDIRPGEKLPLILDMNCTTGSPQAEVKTNGWDRVAVQKRLIVVAPTYDDYATYSEAAYMIQVVDSAASRYSIDPQRVYATGFSNGGALSVALASEYPTRFTAISAAGWMVGARNTTHGYKMPFQVLQGTQEYTERGRNGAMEIMDDEKEAIKDLFAMNGMNRGTPNYQETPYWGYKPDKSYTIYPNYTDYDPYGGSPKKRSGVRWTVNDYYLNGFKNPFAQLILIDGAAHIPHDYHADIAWEFFQHFRRVSGGRILKS